MINLNFFPKKNTANLNPLTLPPKERIKQISAVIQRSENQLRRKFPILQHQNGIGAIIFLLAITGIITNAFLYALDIIPTWFCIFMSALFVSLLHELEHDLIHNLYFKANLKIQNLMMFGTWFFRPNFPSPWFRRKIHLLHHRDSGRINDIEERFLGNGLAYGWQRILCMLDSHFTAWLLAKELHNIPNYSQQLPRPKDMRMIIVFDIIWMAFLLLHFIKFGLDTATPDFINSTTNIVNLLMVSYILPCMVVRACLGFVSSNIHYFGDVKNLLEQTQVFNSWYTLPLQLFCFNFGATHAIHHFVVHQPFYLRQMVAPAAHAVMKKYGVRFNDAGTFHRANRYHASATEWNYKVKIANTSLQP